MNMCQFIKPGPVFAALLLTGCLGANVMESTYSPEKVKANLIVGKTTKDEVRSMYGGAQRMDYADGETWHYSHIKREGFGSSVGKKLVKRGVGSMTSYLPGMGYLFTSNHMVGGAGTTVGHEIRDRIHDRVDEELPSGDEWTDLTIEFDRNGVVKSYRLF